MTAAVIPFARGQTKANPYKVGSPLWVAYRQGADAQDEKWRLALIGRLPPAEARQ
jgi:hypothetical protein